MAPELELKAGLRSLGSGLAALAFRRVGPAAPTVHGALLVIEGSGTAPDEPAGGNPSNYNPRHT